MATRNFGLILGAVVGGGIAAMWLWRRRLATPVQEPAEAPEQMIEGGGVQGPNEQMAGGGAVQGQNEQMAGGGAVQGLNEQMAGGGAVQGLNEQMAGGGVVQGPNEQMAEGGEPPTDQFDNDEDGDIILGDLYWVSDQNPFPPHGNLPP